MTELLSLCPQCKSRLKVPSANRATRIDCPKCKTGFIPNKAEVACPKCKTALPPGSVFCVGCGYDFRRKTTTAAVFVKEPKPTKRKPEPDRFESEKEEFDEPTWREILALPFDAEVVVAEAIILTMWAFFWAGLMIAVFGGMIMALGAMGPITIFSACMLLAGIIRLWMYSSDISLQTLLMLLSGLLGLSALTGWIANMANPAFDPLGFGLFAFMFFVLFGIQLRCTSFYLGRYFGIIRRAALRGSMSVADRGGFVDLYFGVLLGLVGLTPLLTVWAYDFYLALNDQLFPGGNAVFLSMVGVGLVWAYFYMPIGFAVVALRGSANPLLVFKWAFKSLGDYLPLLVLYLPFHFAMWAVGVGLAAGVNKVFEVNPAAGVMLAGLNFVLLQLLLNEYSMTVTLASLGLVMRRNERSLKWAKSAKRINAERD